MNISATSTPIATKFYLKHHWGRRKAASGFWPDRIGTLVSIATDSSHRAKIVENLVSTLVSSFLIGSLYLQVTRTTMISRTSSNFGQIRPRTAELNALKHSSSFIFDWIFFILAGNEDNYKSLNKFDFGQNSAADFGVG